MQSGPNHVFVDTSVVNNAKFARFCGYGWLVGLGRWTGFDEQSLLLAGFAGTEIVGSEWTDPQECFLLRLGLLVCELLRCVL